MSQLTDTGQPIQYSHRHYPEYRKDIKFPEDWLNFRKEEDNTNGLWRIHDDLYDLTDWLQVHPGGSEWLELTKGTDITEAFETHHLSKLPERLLRSFHIRHIDAPRNSTLTFKDDGFYRTLKRRVAKELKKIPKEHSNKSKYKLDLLLILTFLFSTIAIYSWIFVALSALILSWTTIAAHNFIHQRDSWRMYIFNMSLMSVREWRISHVLSHHLFTNTLADLEVIMFEPFIKWLPESKGPSRYAAWFYSPIMFCTFMPMQYVHSMIHCAKTRTFHSQYLIPFLLPLVMYLVTNSNLSTVLSTWMCIIFAGSFAFTVIGLTAGHHHPKVYHDGDALREDRDWGKFQMDTIIDRKEVMDSDFLTLTHFGQHTLHHLFPTIDHSLLPFLIPAVIEICEKFHMNLRLSNACDLAVGPLKQIIKIVPNPIPPGSKDKIC